jgi:hypothetical protein
LADHHRRTATFRAGFLAFFKIHVINIFLHYDRVGLSSRFVARQHSIIFLVVAKSVKVLELSTASASPRGIFDIFNIHLFNAFLHYVPVGLDSRFFTRAHPMHFPIAAKSVMALELSAACTS